MNFLHSFVNKRSVVKETVLVNRLQYFRRYNLSKTSVKKYPFHLCRSFLLHKSLLGGLTSVRFVALNHATTNTGERECRKLLGQKKGHLPKN